MDDAHAARAARTRVEQEVCEPVMGLLAGRAGQVDLALQGPVPATQLGQHVAREPGAEERLLALVLLADLPAVLDRLRAVL